MKSRFSTIVKPLMFLLVVSLFSWLPATAFSSGYNSDELTRRIKTGGYLQKTDNLMIILDGTGKQNWLIVDGTSKKDWFGRETRQIKTAKILIDRIGKTIPNVPHRRMLRVFGPSADGFQDDYSTIFGLFNTDAIKFNPIIATMTHEISDNDPMELTFFSAISDFRKLEGTHAVILISPAEQFSKSAIAESAYLKKAFGGSICFYPIYVGNTAKAEAKMKQFKRIGGCGTFSTYADLDTPEEMTNFVEKVFFAKKRNYTPPTPVTPVITEPTPQDVDNTETIVTDVDNNPYEPELIGDVEKEPITEETYNNDDVIIIERQLPHDKVVTIELHVEFDLNKAIVKEDFASDIENIATFMTQYPETEVLLEGHTCTLGSDAYNMDLSKKRAEAVRNSLNQTFGLPLERIKIRGAGEAEPIADNSTEEGRVRNRRVMAVISTIVSDYIIIEQEISKEEFLSDDFVLPPIEESLQNEIQPMTAPDATMPTDEVGIEPVVEQELPVTTEDTLPIETTTEVMPETTTATEIIVEDVVEETVVTAPEEVTTTDMITEDVVLTEGEAAFDTTEEAPLTVQTEN